MSGAVCLAWKNCIAAWSNEQSNAKQVKGSVWDVGGFSFSKKGKRVNASVLAEKGPTSLR